MYKLIQNIKDELEKIEEKGLTVNNIEMACKLVDMLKDLENIDYWKGKSSYYSELRENMNSGGHSYAAESSMPYSEARDRQFSRAYDEGSSYARRGEHYVRGHYSRADGSYPIDDYMREKHSYKTGGKTEDCKRRMLSALEEHLDALTRDIGNMSQDAECREERDTIMRFIDKLKNVV